MLVAPCPLLPNCAGHADTAAKAVATLKDVIAKYVRCRTKEEAMNCDANTCEDEAVVHFTRIESRYVVSENYLCEPHAQKFFRDFRSSQSVGGGLAHVMPGLACVDLELIAYRIGYQNDPVCIYVHEVGGKRRLCILTDGWAWWALMAQIKQEPAPRPHTHAAWAKTVTELNGKLRHVVLDRREGEDWWSAKLRIASGGSFVNVDVRASDAYILAVASSVPIFVTETALEKFADRGEGTNDD